jgi:carboxyl-terminal processing protease
MSHSAPVSCRLLCGRSFGARLALLVAVLGLGAAAGSALADVTGPQKNDRPITKAITILMSRQHLTRHPLDIEISNRWLNNYVKMLDPRKVFFSQADINSFNEYKDQLDDMAMQGDTSFAYRVFQKFLSRIDERVKLVDELLASNLDLSADEEMITDPDEIAYAKDDAEMKDRWRRRIKFDLLELATEKPPLEGQAAKDKIARRYRQLGKRMKQTDNDELLEMYLTALTTAYDPHTTYKIGRAHV